jgi:hypothetical protein
VFVFQERRGILSIPIRPQDFCSAAWYSLLRGWERVYNNYEKIMGTRRWNGHRRFLADCLSRLPPAAFDNSFGT